MATSSSSTGATRPRCAVTRSERLARYRSLPLPSTKDEHWRFTDLAGFDPDGWTSNGAAAIAAPPSLIDVDVAGVAYVGEGGIEIERAPDGIRFEPLTDEHEVLYSLVGWDEKFAAHNAAMWKHGLLVHVPKGVVVEKPLYVRVANSVEGGSLFWRLLIVAEPESRFTVIEEYTSSSRELVAYSNAAVEIVVQQAAKVEYVSVQNLSLGTWHFASHHGRVERDAELDWVAGGFGSAKGKIRIQNDLAGPGATSRVTGAYFADGTQHLDYDTFQEHIAPSTTSDFAFKGALRDNARTVWRGMIRVEEGAQKTNAYQENRNLLLSKTAHADSIPGLEILANDVRCTHGATLGQVDLDQLFYLMTRGLTRAEAERLIVRGFFQDVLDRVQLEPVREALGAALEARIPQA
jgi:Fe-S cluster assembly protein SufD